MARVNQKLKTYVWLTGTVQVVVVREEWRCSMMVNGGQSVMMAGLIVIQELFAGKQTCRIIINDEDYSQAYT